MEHGAGKAGGSRRGSAFARTVRAGRIPRGPAKSLYDQAYRFRQLAARAAYKRRNELDEHRAIFEAVISGRLDDALGLLSAHYRRTASIIERGDAS